MPSLEQRFAEFIAVLRGLEVVPADAAGKLRTRLEALDFELRTTIIPGERFDVLAEYRAEATRLLNALSFPATC
ncbi:hypothetical protein [Nocardia sp. NPDC048505]|uniref:hypothetical protein n=1 Tax=unclassified Nocardia TaxID=2637762 RepID=UPI0033F8B598